MLQTPSPNANGAPYSYGPGGTLSYDPMRQATIQHNFLNLPFNVIIGDDSADGNRMMYFYDATGRKWRREVYAGETLLHSTTYLGPAVFDSSDTLSIYHSAGRLRIAGGIPEGHEYSLRDHLGNERVRIWDRNHDAQLQLSTDPQIHEIISTTDYYPFGLPHADYAQQPTRTNRHLYNGKELETAYQYQLYDNAARWYDPALGRFTGVDPLADEFASYSPYVYTLNNPINLIDPDGRAPMGPGDPPKGPGYYRANVNSRYVGFGVRHPVAALRIGFGVTPGASNISTNATRFATRGEVLHGSKRIHDDRGSQNGAFRHALWQASITSEFDQSVAAQAGNAHEVDAFADLSVRTFSDLDQADQTVDLLNNQIGQSIGSANPNADMLQLAGLILDEFANNGLYTASKDKNGNYTISKTTISSSQYNQLQQIFGGLNANGRTAGEQKAVDDAQRRLNEATKIPLGSKL